MELDGILQVMHKRNDEVERRENSLQGTIVPFMNNKEKIVFTIGYEKRDIDDFVRILQINNVEILVDIRANGHSRKPGFSNGTLKNRLESVGINYLHVAKLGIPKELRAHLKTKGYNWLFKEYEKRLNHDTNELKKLEKVVNRGTSCLMCFELEPRECHRSITAKKLEDNGFEIAHL
ncbi:hypothetical protein BMS3Bbin16_00929 [archaeon BMS3Bbin16]|nr:hypothetical protein BMS3Bbin16_00929 [archaeon BMS3Bbin16]